MIIQRILSRSAKVPRPPCGRRRWLSTAVREGLAKPLQSYISGSRDPYLNLSIEHHLLQNTCPDSALLFLYVNKPSIIIGRNQNPWLEVNLALLDAAHRRPGTEPPALGTVDLVRRRSGGGTVFHDEGNVNWSIICPSAHFTRDKHAEMIVRALRSCGVDRARVNARHDIVLDQGQRGLETDPNDTHTTPYEATDFATPRPLKVSGSAYKLTRNRALHHGTCLLSSPNLNSIPDYLHSPAKPFLTARGVESVSSPVGNVLLSNDDFIQSVQKEFKSFYSANESLQCVHVGEEWLEDTSVRKGYDELKSPDWTYLQTPQFTVSTRSQVALDVDLEMAVRYGAVNAGQLTVGADGGASDRTIDLGREVIGCKLHEVESWNHTMGSTLEGLDPWRQQRLIEWLQNVLPRGP